MEIWKEGKRYKDREERVDDVYWVGVLKGEKMEVGDELIFMYRLVF